MADKKGKKKEEKKTQNTKSLKEALGDLSTRGRVVLALFTAMAAVTLLFLFLYALINAVTPDNIIEEDYESVLTKINGRTWSIKKGDDKTLAHFLSGFKADSAESRKSGTALILILKGEESDRTLYFGYRDERVQGFVGSVLFSLFLSQGKDGNNMALTLLSEETKIVFYEE